MGRRDERPRLGRPVSTTRARPCRGSTWSHQDGACLSYLLSQCRLSSPLLFTSHMLPSIKPPSPESSVGKESTCSAGDPGSVPGPGRSAGEGTGHPLQYSCTSLVAQLVKNLTAMRKSWFDPWVGMIPWRRERLYSLQYSGLELCSSWGHKEWDTTEQLSLSLFQWICLLDLGYHTLCDLSIL